MKVFRKGQGAANDFKQEKLKVRSNILKSSKPFVHSCYTGWLF